MLILKNKFYDAVICLGFETISFAFAIKYFYDLPIFLIYHKNIDELTNSVKLFFLKQYTNKVYHVVFEDFFAKRLIDLGVKSDRIFVVPHPIQEIKIQTITEKYDCVGLCNSNEELFIEEAISKEKDFKHNNLSILLRSKSQSKIVGSVSVIKGFIEKQRYDKIIGSGRTVLVPLPSTYIYRLSGSIYDALARRKIVLTSSKFYSEEYSRRYPGTCFHVDSVNDLIQYLSNQPNINANITGSFDKFLKDHSIDSTSKALEGMLKKIVKGK